MNRIHLFIIVILSVVFSGLGWWRFSRPRYRQSIPSQDYSWVHEGSSRPFVQEDDLQAGRLLFFYSPNPCFFSLVDTCLQTIEIIDGSMYITPKIVPRYSPLAWGYVYGRLFFPHGELYTYFYDKSDSNAETAQRDYISFVQSMVSVSSERGVNPAIVWTVVDQLLKSVPSVEDEQIMQRVFTFIELLTIETELSWEAVLQEAVSKSFPSSITLQAFSERGETELLYLQHFSFETVDQVEFPLQFLTDAWKSDGHFGEQSFVVCRTARAYVCDRVAQANGNQGILCAPFVLADSFCGTYLQSFSMK